LEDIVYSRSNGINEHDPTKVLRMDMRGEVIGKGKGQSQVKVKFEEPGAIWHMAHSNLTPVKPSTPFKRFAGGLTVSQTVYSVSKYNKDEFGHIHYGMQGEVTGESPDKVKVLVTFSNPDGDDVQWPCLPENISLEKPETTFAGNKVGDIVYCQREVFRSAGKTYYGMRAKVTGPGDSKGRVQVKFETLDGAHSLHATDFKRTSPLPDQYTAVGDTVTYNGETQKPWLWQFKSVDAQLSNGIPGKVTAKKASDPKKIIFNFGKSCGEWPLLPSEVIRIKPVASWSIHKGKNSK